jgi:uncharacterized membrane-anchored protein YhcB (DUF1043 family)
MTNAELLAENTLLQQQVEQLQQQLDSNQSPDWRHLIGAWNRTAAEQLKAWDTEQAALNTASRNNAKPLSPENQLRVDILRKLIARTEEVHAIVEARQQQRNLALGLPPTEWQFLELLGLTTIALPDHGTSQPDISHEAQTFAAPALVQQRPQAR